MNNTQLIGMRQMHETMTGATKQEMTAVEMALTSHRLNRTGNVATLRDGTRFVWDTHANKWVR